MDEKLISNYINNFSNLNRGISSGMGKAPHKPIRLLSIISLIKKQQILKHRVFITSEHVLEFRDIWKKLVSTEKELNQMVYELYGLTEEEIEIVENS